MAGSGRSGRSPTNWARSPRWTGSGCRPSVCPTASRPTTSPGSTRRASTCTDSAGQPLDPVEDQVEAELELLRVVVARRHHVPGGELVEMRELVDREPRQHDLGEVRGLLRSVEREPALLQGEAVDVAVDRREGVRGELEGEARRPQAAEYGVVRPERGRARVGP